MENVFLTILSMSTTASFVIVSVMLLRLLLKKAPAIFSYILWGIVLVKLVCPISLEAGFGIIPDVRWESLNKEAEKTDGNKSTALTLDESAAAGENAGAENLVVEIKDAAKQQNAGIAPAKSIVSLPSEAITVLGMIWLIVGSSLLFYQTVNYVQFKRNINKRNIRTPFVAGFLKPQIYLPEELEEEEKSLVLAHEKVHIRRKDYLIKPFAFFLCCVYWFNPFVWAAFSLMVRDMESACDEAVLKRIGMERKKEYAMTLLSLSGERVEKTCLIAFGEDCVKARIKRVMKMKKTNLWVGIFAAIIIFGACGLLFTNASRVETKAEVNEEAAYGNYEAALSDANSEREQMIEALEQEISLLEKQKRKLEKSGEQENAGKQTEDIEEEIKLLEEKEKNLKEETIAFATEETGGISKETKETVEKLAEKYGQYGLKVSVTENDYQFYFNDEPICFFADNENGWEKEAFKGTVFMRPASEENGFRGVITKYDEKGNIIGLRLISKEERESFQINNN